MKKRFAVLAALIMAMTLACACVCAEGTPDPAAEAEFANDIYHEYLGRIASTEDEIGYLIGTAEYGMMKPLDVSPAEYLEKLEKATLTPADITEARERSRSPTAR